MLRIVPCSSFYTVIIVTCIKTAGMTVFFCRLMIINIQSFIFVTNIIVPLRGFFNHFFLLLLVAIFLLLIIVGSFLGLRRRDKLSCLFLLKLALGRYRCSSFRRGGVTFLKLLHHFLLVLIAHALRLEYIHKVKELVLVDPSIIIHIYLSQYVDNLFVNWSNVTAKEIPFHIFKVQVKTTH
jgi:hypothetical protein